MSRDKDADDRRDGGYDDGYMRVQVSVGAWIWHSMKLINRGFVDNSGFLLSSIV